MEDKILSHLVFTEGYTRRVLPFISEDYFSQNEHKVIFSVINDYVSKYNKIPTKDVLRVEVDSMELIEPVHEACMESINSMESDNPNIDWLIDKTEKWCQDRALYNAITRAVKVYDGGDKELDRGGIPKLMTDALGVNFDNKIGHDYLDDWESRYEFYHEKKNKLPFHIDLLNYITNGGVLDKSLNIIMAPTGGGKSLSLCDFAANYMTMGKNVVYITLEMAEEEISRRIDANLMDTNIQDIESMPKEMFEKKIRRIRDNTPGKLIIKEYPTASAHANHFRYAINELKLKKNFDIDVLIIDYINICSSSRFKAGAHNSYTIVKSIAEEIRGLGIEFGIPVWSATQTNRNGAGTSDIDITDVAESWGLPATADLMLAQIPSEELDELGQILFKQLKNRYNSKTSYRRFVLGIDYAKMKLYNVEQDAQEGIINDDRPAFDKSSFGEENEDRESRKNKFQKFQI